MKLGVVINGYVPVIQAAQTICMAASEVGNRREAEMQEEGASD